MEDRIDPSLAATILTLPGAASSEAGTVWGAIRATAGTIPGTEVPATFQLQLGERTLWANANATEHMGEYIARLGNEASAGIRSQEILSGFRAAVSDAMSAIGSGAPGRYFGTYGGWELGINTETGVIYHALMQ